MAAKMYTEKETKKQVKTFLLFGFGLFAVIAGVIAFSRS
jgi:nitrate reductase NapE component